MLPLTEEEQEEKLTPKMRLFIEAYIACNFDGSEAAIKAGYSKRSARQTASRLLTNATIARAIETRLTVALATFEVDKNEVLRLLVSHMRGTFGDFLDVTDKTIDFEKAQKAEQLHLIRKYRGRETTIINDKLETETHIMEHEIELYDAQAAAVQLGKHLSLFNEKLDINVKQLSDEQLLRLTEGKKP